MEIEMRRLMEHSEKYLKNSKYFFQDSSFTNPFSFSVITSGEQEGGQGSDPLHGSHQRPLFILAFC